MQHHQNQVHNPCTRPKRESWLFKTLTKFKILSKVKYFNFFVMTIQGWVGGKIHITLFIFFASSYLLTTMIACITKLFVIMRLDVLYKLDNLCHILFCSARMCTLLRVSAIKGYPTTKVWFWLSHTLEFQSTIFLLHLKVPIASSQCV